MPSLLNDLHKRPKDVPEPFQPSGLTSSLVLGLENDPDKEIQVREDAKTLGVTPEVVRTNPAMRTRASMTHIKNRVEVRRPITEEFLVDPDNAAIAHDDVEALTDIEEEAGFFGRLHDFLDRNITEPIVEFGEENIYDPGTTGYRHGRLTHELGHAGHELRGSTGANREQVEEKVGDIKSEMESLGMSNDGWIGFITSAAELIGQQVGTFDQPEAAQRVLTGVTGGTIAGAAIGFAAGPGAPVVAPITAAGGAVAGGISGLISHFVTDAFIVESGHAYIDLVDQGVPEPEAEALAVGVGVINAGLELAGASIVAAPFSKAIKNRMKRALGEAVARPSVRRAAARFVGSWGKAVGGETATEVAQEGVNIVAEEIGKTFQEGLTDDFSVEETIDRLEDIAVKTFKGMAILGLPGAGASYVTDRSKANRALKAQASFRRIHGMVGESKLARRSPEAATSHLEKSLGISSVQMPAQQFTNLVSDMDGVPADLLPDERLLQIYNEAVAINGDVTVPVGPLMKTLLGQENRALFERYQPHVRWGPGEMTATEAAEFQTSGLTDALADNVAAVVEDGDAIVDRLIQDRVSSLSDDVRAAIDGSTGLPPGMAQSVGRVVEEQAEVFIADVAAGATGPTDRPVVIGPRGKLGTRGPDARPIVVGPSGKVELEAGPDTRPSIAGPKGKRDDAGPLTRPVVVGPSGRLETGGPDTRPIVIGPDGKAEELGPDTRPAVVGPLGKVETGGPASRPLVIGPDGRLGTKGPEARPEVVGPKGKRDDAGPDARPEVVGPKGKRDDAGPDARPEVVGPSGRRDDAGPDARPEVVGPSGRRDDAGPTTRPVVIGPSGWLETTGPDARPVVVGPSGKVELGGPTTRPGVVGSLGKSDGAGPPSRPVVVGPSGWLETSGPDARPIVIGPDGRAEAMGPGTRPAVVGPDGKLGTSGPETRPIVIGADGFLGTSGGPQTRPSIDGKQEVLRNTEDVSKAFADAVIKAVQKAGAMPAEARGAVEGAIRERTTVFAQELMDNFDPSIGETKDASTVKTTPEVSVAQDSLGLQALFNTAREAGMTEKQYTAYQSALQRAANTTANRKSLALVKREQRQVGKDIKEATAKVATEVQESLGNEPVYSALRGLGPDKLDRGSIEQVYGDDAQQVIKELRTAGAQVTNLKEPGGIDIDAWAGLYDFEAGDIMVNAMRDVTPEKQEVQKRAKEQVQQQRPDLFSRQADLQETIVALLHDDTGAVIAAEIDALTTDKKAGRLKPKLVREVARRTMSQHQVSDVTVNKYLDNAKREGREAGRLLRRGDREGARAAKVNQLLNVEFAREAEVQRDGIQKGRKYLAQFQQSNRKFPSLGPGYIEAIRDITDQFSMSPRLSENKREQLEKFVTKAQADGANFTFPSRLLDDAKRNYKDMTLHEFELVVQKVRELQHSGIKSRKNLDQDKKNTIGIRVDGMVDALRAKPQPVQDLETRGRRGGFSKAYTEAGLLFLNTDSVLRDLDGFKEHGLGPAYQAIKRPIDQATTNGYGSKTNVGLVNRHNNIAKEVKKLYSAFTKAELATLSKRNIRIDGFAKPISRNTYLSLLLNTGNEQNRQAVVDSGQITDAQMEALIEYASKRDMDFVQSMWDYLDSFWGEIEAATERRRGFKPEKVQATAIETEHGIYSGGYYPLRYDNNKGVNDPSKESLEDQISQARYGKATSSHTRRDHTEERIGSAGRPVLLDLFAAHSHLDQVAYDLEMGDAVNEVYSTLYDKRTRKAFQDAGRQETWRALDLWLGDVTTGEMHSGGVVEKSLRWLRAGFTINKLAWNVGVAGIQVVGILQTSVLLGKGNTLAGLGIMLKLPMTGKVNVFKYVSNQSQVMQQREETFHKDIADASQLISDSYLKRVTPGKSLEFIQASMFYGIKKMQRFVDTWTWLAAKRDGMKKFENDEARAVEYADRTVTRAQASGNFQERTAFERGSINSKVRQSELVRSFTALISYFVAKNNVAWERTKKTNFRNPGQVVGWATDMALLYMVEAALVGLIRGQWPDYEEEDEPAVALGAYLASEGASAMFAGMPLIREISSEIGGFRGGGVYSSVLGDVGKITEQITQGEIDEALIYSANTLGGTLFKYPASQINKTARAVSLADDGEDVSWIEYFMGPQFDKYR